MVQEGYIYRDSIIHKMNPSLKMLATILFIVLIFIPSGFIFQLVLFVAIFVLFLLSKLPFKLLLKISVSILFMAIALTLINWISYKNLGTIFDLESKFNILQKPFWMNLSNPNLVFLDGKWFAHGDIWGGQIINDIVADAEFQKILSDLGGTLKDQGNGFYIIEGIEGKDNLFQFGDRLGKLFPKYNFEYDYGFSGAGVSQLYFFAYQTEWYSMTSFALALMAYVSIKIFLIIFVITLLTSTMSPIEMTYGIEDLLSPLRYLKAPISEWSMTIALSIRFIPSLLDESNRVLRAQASRGVDFKNGNTFDKMKSLSSLVVPLFSIAFRKAEELSNAMEARAYNPRNVRTRYRIFTISLFDWIFFGLVLFYFGLVIMLCFFDGKQLLFTPFGVLDAIIML
ncbi:MAG: energy-coupling factor transporter transmembrane component T family protein [Mycoplasmoidaceae bacterium]